MSQARNLLKLISEIGGFGGAGVDFEDAFVNACYLLGLGVKRSTAITKLWDLQAVSGSWNRALFGSQINIKTYNARWIFGDNSLASSLPWESGSLPLNFDVNKAENDVYRYLLSIGLAYTVFLKPSSTSIEDMVKKFTSRNDITSLSQIFSSRKLWLAARIGKNFGVRISTDEQERRVRGIAILLPNGAVFGRSEKPRGGRIAFKHDRKSHAGMGYKYVSIIV